MTRSVIAGQKINLRTRFRDDLTEPALASGVVLYIFDPDADSPLDTGSAYMSVSNPVYIGEGIYEYGFNVPDDADEGTWSDLWYGTLNSQLLSGEFNFLVYSVGEAVELGSQLNNNNIIEVILESGIQSIDGTYLDDGYTFEFLTTISPSYTDTRKVRLEIGSHLQELRDYTIQLVILEASLEADQLSFYETRNSGFFEHARREWTTCKAALTLLDNVSSHGLRSKSLDNLRVEYDPSIIMKTLSRLMACQERWEAQLIAGGYAKANNQPRSVVKGEYDPDRPTVGRMWSPTDGTLSDKVPAANTKDKNTSSRRWDNIFRKGKSPW